MNNFMFAGSARVVTAPGLNAEPSRNKWELLRSHITRLLRGVASSACVFLPLIVGASGSRDYDSTLVRAKGKGQVTIVYQDDAVQPENRDAIKSIRDSGVFERMADRLTKAVALPHDLQVVVTDNVPKGIDDPTTEVDGRRIFWPAAFSKATLDVLTEFLPEVIASKGAPRAIAQENFTADVLNVWGNQFILGHEFGHALIHQLNLPLTGLEEDSADGFATFFTVNDKDTGPNAALGAAVLFDAMGSKRPNLTLEDFSSIFRGGSKPRDRHLLRRPNFRFACGTTANLNVDACAVSSGLCDGIHSLFARSKRLSNVGPASARGSIWPDWQCRQTFAGKGIVLVTIDQQTGKVSAETR